jgi:hypothetical protein
LKYSGYQKRRTVMKKTGLIFLAVCCITGADETGDRLLLDLQNRLQQITVDQQNDTQPEFGGIEGDSDSNTSPVISDNPSFVTEVAADNPVEKAKSLNKAEKYQEAFTVLRNALVASGLQNMELRLELAKQYVLLMEKKQFPANANMSEINDNLDNHLNALGAHAATAQGASIRIELNDLRERVATLRQGHYDASLGRRLANASTSVNARQGRCGGSNFSRGDCYECTGAAIEKALGNSGIFFSHPGSMLNRSPYYAKFFATEWSENLHKPVFGLTRSYYSTNNYAAGQRAANEAPVGSVIVWDQCGRSPAGHIAIITSPGVACSSFCAPVSNTCGTRAADGSTRVIGVFTPVGTNR